MIQHRYTYDTDYMVRWVRSLGTVVRCMDPPYRTHRTPVDPPYQPYRPYRTTAPTVPYHRAQRTVPTLPTVPTVPHQRTQRTALHRIPSFLKPYPSNGALLSKLHDIYIYIYIYSVCVCTTYTYRYRCRYRYTYTYTYRYRYTCTCTYAYMCVCPAVSRRYCSVPVTKIRMVNTILRVVNTIPALSEWSIQQGPLKHKLSFNTIPQLNRYRSIHHTS